MFSNLISNRCWIKENPQYYLGEDEATVCMSKNVTFCEWRNTGESLSEREETVDILELDELGDRWNISWETGKSEIHQGKGFQFSNSFTVNSKESRRSEAASETISSCSISRVNGFTLVTHISLSNMHQALWWDKQSHHSPSQTNQSDWQSLADKRVGTRSKKRIN